MHLLTCLLLVPTISTSSQTCIWVPKGYFLSCSYKYHRINKEWELKNSRLKQGFIGWSDFVTILLILKEIPCLTFRTWVRAGSCKRELWNATWMWENKRWIWTIDSERVWKCLLLQNWLVKNFWVFWKNVSNSWNFGDTVPIWKR